MGFRVFQCTRTGERLADIRIYSAKKKSASRYHCTINYSYIVYIVVCYL